MGNLNEQDFWDAFYDYDTSDLSDYFSATACKMRSTGCRCDRKEHVLNAGVGASGAFDMAITDNNGE
ncbi:MAG TPA: hypothetical protein EYP98_19205 [Planctomycetes bacterium]|nr:hypothetical protein [Planctomycetota bacterium]